MYMQGIKQHKSINMLYALNESFGFIFKIECKYLFIICFVKCHIKLDDIE